MCGKKPSWIVSSCDYYRIKPQQASLYWWWLAQQLCCYLKKMSITKTITKMNSPVIDMREASHSVKLVLLDLLHFSNLHLWFKDWSVHLFNGIVLDELNICSAGKQQHVGHALHHKTSTFFTFWICSLRYTVCMLVKLLLLLFLEIFKYIIIISICL